MAGQQADIVDVQGRSEFRADDAGSSRARSLTAMRVQHERGQDKA